MKWLALIVGMMIGLAAYSQESKETYKALEDGGVLVTGVDFFGAQVLVRYDNKGLRMYQERILGNEKTYGMYDAGVLVEHGTIITHENDLPQLVEAN